MRNANRVVFILFSSNSLCRKHYLRNEKHEIFDSDTRLIVVKNRIEIADCELNYIFLNSFNKFRHNFISHYFEVCHREILLYVRASYLS